MTSDATPGLAPVAHVRTGTLPLRAYYLAAYAVGGAYLPFFPRWLEGRGIHGVRQGILCAAAPAMGLVAPTLFGVVSDRLAVRVGLLQLACGGALCSFAVLAGLEALHRGPGFETLLAVALAIALFRAPMTLLADVVAIERAPPAGTTYGRVRLWGSVGFLATALLAGLWLDPYEPLGLPLVCTAALAAAFTASLAFPRQTEMPRRGQPGDLARLLASADFRLLLVAVFFGQCGHVAYDMCFSMHLFDLGVPRPLIGLAWTIGTTAEVALMAWSGPLLRSCRASSLLTFAFAAACVRWVLLSFLTSSTVILVLQPLHALSFALFWIAAVSYTSERAPPGALAAAQGLFVSAMGVGSVVGMLLWGPAYQHGGGSLVFRCAAAFSACACACAFALGHAPRAVALPGR